MSEQDEIQKLKEQINNLQAVVNRLESGESKYITMPQRLVKQRASVLKKYFGTDEEFSKKLGVERGYAYRLKESINQGVSKIADSTFKHLNSYDTNKQIKSIVKNEEMLEEYLCIFDLYCSMVAKKILNTN